MCVINSTNINNKIIKAIMITINIDTQHKYVIYKILILRIEIDI